MNAQPRPTRATMRSAGAAVIACGAIVLGFNTSTIAAVGMHEHAAAPLATDPTSPGPEGTSSVDASEGKLVLVLDASGSMELPDSSGAPRIDAAHAALTSVIDSLPEDANVGFRVFGATEVGLDNPASCEDSQLLVPIGSDNADALRAAVDQYQPFGETPIGYALQEAAADLGTEGQRSILLVSDGESNCQPDPCDVARELAADGIDLAINTVGMNVEGAAREQLECIAEVTGGSYFDASDAETLTRAMDTLAVRAFRPFSVAGTPVQGAADAGSAPTVQPGGQYTDALPAPGEILHYVIPRGLDGSSIHVGLTSRADGGKAQVKIQLATPSGKKCATGWATTFSDAASYALLSGSAVAQGGHDDSDECVTADELVLTLEGTEFMDGGEGTPFEFLITEEPRLSQDHPAPPKAVDDAPRDWSLGITTDGSGGEVVAGASFNDAPVLAPGSYTSEILTGETQVFAVEVGWGQHIRANVHMEPQTLPGPGIQFSGVKLGIYSPQRGAVLDVLARAAGPHGSYSIVLENEPTVIAGTMPSVQWDFQNTIMSHDTPALPGTYFVVLGVDALDGEAASLPYTLGIEVVGTAGTGAPVYESHDAGQPEPSSSPEPAAEPTVEESTPEPATREASEGAEATDVRTRDTADAGTSPLLLGGLAAGGLALVAGGAWALMRRNTVPRS